MGNAPRSTINQPRTVTVTGSAVRGAVISCTSRCIAPNADSIGHITRQHEVFVTKGTGSGVKLTILGGDAAQLACPNQGFSSQDTSDKQPQNDQHNG
jgi:hypothetical protein